MDLISRGADGYFHPTTEEELRALILHAGATNRKLRVRGASHSVSAAIYTDGFDGSGAPPALPGAGIDVMLDGYRGLTITADPGAPGHAIVEVEAGCHLGKDPYDPTQTSTWENSLNYQLQERGYALDDLGGISHQTISGFLSTGSSGGSVQYSIDDNIVRLRFIDGLGEIHAGRSALAVEPVGVDRRAHRVGGAADAQLLPGRAGVKDEGAQLFLGARVEVAVSAARNDVHR